MLILVIATLSITSVEVAADSSSEIYNSNGQSYAKGGFFVKSDKVLSDDLSGNLLQDTGSTTTNTEFMRFTNYSGSAGYFDIKIVAVDVCSAYTSTNQEIVGIAIFD